jgi:hypothetical protein
MLKEASEMFNNLNNEAMKDNKKEVFVDAFTEFIYELDSVDLSHETKQNLYDVFVKDMNIYFKNKHYENTEV